MTGPEQIAIRQSVADYLQSELDAIEDPDEPAIAGLEVAIELIRNLDEVEYLPTQRKKMNTETTGVETNIDAFNMGYGLGKSSGIEEGRAQERQRLIDALDTYLQLTLQADPSTGDELSADWHAGFQAALLEVIGDQQ